MLAFKFFDIREKMAPILYDLSPIAEGNHFNTFSENRESLQSFMRYLMENFSDLCEENLNLMIYIPFCLLIMTFLLSFTYALWYLFKIYIIYDSDTPSPKEAESPSYEQMWRNAVLQSSIEDQKAADMKRLPPLQKAYTRAKSEKEYQSGPQPPTNERGDVYILHYDKVKQQQLKYSRLWYIFRPKIKPEGIVYVYTHEFQRSLREKKDLQRELRAGEKKELQKNELLGMLREKKRKATR